MPYGDGTGPMGRGPMTGRGRGPCGRGMGFGYGRRAWYGRGYNRIDERTFLENEIRYLEEQLAMLKERLKALL